MKKNRVRLTEAQLHRVIRESVAQVIRENEEDELFDFARGAVNKVGGDIKNLGSRVGNWFGGKAKQGANAVSNKAQGAYNTVANKAQGAYNTVAQGAQNAYNTAKQGAQNAYNTAKDAYGTVQNGVNQGVQAMSNYANDVKKAGMQAADAGEVKSAINTINKLMQSGLINQNVGNQAIKSMQKALGNKQY